jgi:hypothetical protein
MIDFQRRKIARSVLELDVSLASDKLDILEGVFAK